MDKEEIRLKLDDLDSKITECQKAIAELESRHSIFKKRELRERKAYLEMLLNEQSTLFAQYSDICLQEKLEQKKVACKELLDELKDKSVVQCDDGGEKELSVEVKQAFVDEITSFQESDALSQEYDRIETDSYIITEGFVLNKDGKVDIRVTTNDLPIAAKHHTHFDTLDSMLVRYMGYLDSKKEEKPIQK